MGTAVIRFIVILLSSLSLLLSPAAAAAAAMESGPAQMECSMAGADSGMADHEKMGCCKPTCTAPGAAAVLPSSGVGQDAIADAGPLLLFAGDPMLPSVSPGALDPPPRLHLS